MHGASKKIHLISKGQKKKGAKRKLRITSSSDESLSSIFCHKIKWQKKIETQKKHYKGNIEYILVLLV
jgi:hypothetical protein